MSRLAKDDDSLLVQDPAVSQPTSPYSAHNRVTGSILDTRGSIPGENTTFAFQVSTEVPLRTAQMRPNLIRILKELYPSILVCNVVQHGSTVDDVSEERIACIFGVEE
jgi:hypothetical protein